MRPLALGSAAFAGLCAWVVLSWLAAVLIQWVCWVVVVWLATLGLLP